MVSLLQRGKIMEQAIVAIVGIVAVVAIVILSMIYFLDE
jgi:hypothetical protein